MLAPLCVMVPYSLVMRAGLKTEVSIFASFVLNHISRTLRKSAMICLVVGTRVNLEQEMIPIPAVCDNRLLEAHRHQLFHHCGGHFARRFLFRLGGADAAWSDRIGIHENL